MAAFWWALRHSPRGATGRPAELSIASPSLRALFRPGPHVCPRLLGRAPGRAPSSPLRSASPPRASPLACCRCPSAACLGTGDRRNARALLVFGFGYGVLPCRPFPTAALGRFCAPWLPWAVGAAFLPRRFPPGPAGAPRCLPAPVRGCPGSGSCLLRRETRPGSGRAFLGLFREARMFCKPHREPRSLAGGAWLLATRGRGSSRSRSQSRGSPEPRTERRPGPVALRSVQQSSGITTAPGMGWG